jgi:hypothetical protein
MSTVTLTDAEVSREAMGRILAIVGGAVSVTGTALLLSVNPKVKQVARGGFAALPTDTRKRVLIGAGIGGIIVLGVGLWIRAQAKKRVAGGV